MDPLSFRAKKDLHKKQNQRAVKSDHERSFSVNRKMGVRKKIVRAFKKDKDIFLNQTLALSDYCRTASASGYNPTTDHNDIY